jgi:hypothetical protein
MKNYKMHFVWMVAVALLVFQAVHVAAGEYYQYLDKDGNMVFTDDLSKVPKEKMTGIKTYESVVSKPQPSTGDQAEDTQAVEQTEPPPVASEETETMTGGSAEESAPEAQSAAPEDVETPADETSDQSAAEAPSDSGTANAVEPEGSSPAEESDASQTPLEAPESSDYRTMKAQFENEKIQLDQELNRLQAEKQALEKQNTDSMSSMELNAYEEKVKDLNDRIDKQEKEKAQFQNRVTKFNRRITSHKRGRIIPNTSINNSTSE